MATYLNTTLKLFYLDLLTHNHKVLSYIREVNIAMFEHNYGVIFSCPLYIRSHISVLPLTVVSSHQGRKCLQTGQSSHLGAEKI